MPPLAGAAAVALSGLGTSFAESSATCSPDGEMLWERGPDGREAYSLCYAPAPRDGGQGPTGGHMKCDAGSYFAVEAPEFCCRNPRMEIAGRRKAVGPVCGDLLAEFEQGDQKIRVARGPSTSGTRLQMAELGESGFGKGAPSPLAFRDAKRAGRWRPLAGSRCGGRSGTLVAWLHSEPAGRAEFCPTGSTPVHGAGYASWSCDGTYTQEKYLHCCKVKGRLHCASRLGEHRGRSQCSCKGHLGGEVAESGLPPLLLAGAAPRLALRRRAPRSCRPYAGCCFL